MNIAIASGKGGTGKTTISTNLATYLSKTDPVVLVDLDVEEPNSGLFVKGNLEEQKDMYKYVPSWDKTNCSLCGKCQRVCNFNAVLKLGRDIMVFPELCHGCFACSELCPMGSLPMVEKKMGDLRKIKSDKLNFVESKLMIGEEQAVPLIKQTKDYVNKHFDDNYIKIYDSPPGTSCPVIEAVKDVDFVLLVTEPTPFGFHDLKLAIETMRQINIPFYVIINKNGIGNNDVEKYCEKEKIKIIAKFKNSQEIAESYSNGDLLFEKYPNFKSEMLKISNLILKNQKGGSL